MFSDPKTSIVALLYFLSLAGKSAFPEWAQAFNSACDLLLGGGFLAAADANKMKAAASVPLRSILWVIGAVLIVAALLSPALLFAQTVTVDLNRASLAWGVSTDPATGNPDGFTAKCGKISGVYTVTTPITDPAARSVPVRSVVNGSGVWFCAMSAYNRYGTSDLSNEISFDAGAVPAAPANLILQAR